MLRRIEKEEMGDYVFEVLVPMERVSEVKKGKRTESNRKFFPGYVIANCTCSTSTTASWTRPGTSSRKPTAFSTSPVRKIIRSPCARERGRGMLAQVRDVKRAQAQNRLLSGRHSARGGWSLRKSDRCRRRNRPRARRAARSVNIFGRSTPVDLEYWQVEKA
jgi:transcriptional antiterminator NusG